MIRVLARRDHWVVLRAAMLGALVAAMACDGQSLEGQAALLAASERQALVDERLEQVRQELDRPFVMFSAPMLLIEELGARRAPPVRVGSRPGRDTMTSDAPDVVSVEQDGTLVAHRDGRTHIRSADSRSILTVVVRAPRGSADWSFAAQEARKAVSP